MNAAATETYAVSLFFDDASSARIKATVESFAAATENHALTEHGTPPHITLGMFHAEKSDEPQLQALFAQIAAECPRAFSVVFAGVDAFRDKVLFLSLDRASDSFVRLQHLNARLHEIVLTQFAAGGNRNYLPENFFPHVALAVKLTKEQCAKAREQGIWGNESETTAQGGGAPREARSGASEVSEGMERAGVAQRKCGTPDGDSRCAQKTEIPTSAKVTAIGLARCHPYQELARISLATDSLSAAQRHKNMAAIHSTGGKLEVALRSELFRFGFRFRKNDKRLLGSPDIVFPHYRAVIFVNGCFWHAHGWRSEESAIATPARDEPILYIRRCEKFRMPTTNPDFWRTKFEKNRARDKRDIAALLEQGWRVGVVWECSITGKKRAQKIRSVAEKISLWLEEGQGEAFCEF